MYDKAKRLLGVMVSVALLSAGVSACGSGSGGGHNSGNTVRIGITPYFEYQPWIIAHKLGLDKEQGLNLSFVELKGPSSAAEAMAHGDVDVISTCYSCDFPLYKSMPDLRDWVITNLFKGFIIIGRKGETTTYENLSNRLGRPEAKKEILRSFKGKTFTIRRVAYEPMLRSALSQVGLSEKDIKIVSYSDDAQAALAFIRGVGDYYMGSLPQESKLLLQHHGQYVNVGGQKILGPAGLWYSTMASTSGWLGEHRATAVKMLAIWYRTMRYLHSQPDRVIPMFRKAINEQAAANFSTKQVRYIVNNLESFYTLRQAKSSAYDNQSNLYWRPGVTFYAKQSDALPRDFTPEKYFLDQAYFESLLDNPKLLKWIRSPLQTPERG